MTYIPASLRARVVARTQESCEYCLVYADYAAFKHEIDHVIAVKHGKMLWGRCLLFYYMEWAFGADGDREEGLVGEGGEETKWGKVSTKKKGFRLLFD